MDNLLDKNDHHTDLTVYCSSRSYSEKPVKYRNAALTYIPLNANGAQSVLYDIWSLFHAVFKRSDTTLLLGVSGAICLPFIRSFSKTKIVTNIDGLEWRRDKWGKWGRKFLKLTEKIGVRYSDFVVADNKGIADYVLDEYGIETEVIAYGGRQCRN